MDETLQGVPRIKVGSRTTRFVALGLVGVVGVVLTSAGLQFYVGTQWALSDARAYWSTGQDGFTPYTIAPGDLGAYLYSPAFAQVIGVVTWLPWVWFASLWVALEAVAFIWLLRPLGYAWTAVLFLLCTPELMLGNIYGFLSVAVVLALTGWPGAWVVPILTKPVLGIGILWHVVRREWRSVLVAVTVTAAITCISFWLDPQMWSQWIHFLLDNTSESGAFYPVRLLMSASLLVVAARRDARWLVPCALLCALPVIGGISVLTMLTAIPRLVLPSPGGQAAP